MVARHDGSGSPATGAIGALFSWWRRVLGSFLQTTARLIRRSPALVAGVSAALIGSVGAGTYAALTSGVLPAAQAALAIPLWAGIRLFVLLTVAHGGSEPDRASMLRSWGWGLTPFAVAFTAPLHALSFVLSALITWRALVLEGARPRRSALLVALSYGFQLAALLALWLMRNFVLAGQIMLLG